MTNIRITKQFSFETGHALYGYDGKCRNVHGHSYKLYVTVIGSPITDSGNVKFGMVIDFKDMKKRLKEFLDPIDHVCLNDLDYFKKHNPTTENIAKYIYQNFKKDIEPLGIVKVRVWESESSSVTYYE